MISWMRVTLSPFKRILPTANPARVAPTQIRSRLHLDVHFGRVVQHNVHILVKALTLTAPQSNNTVICPSIRIFDWSYSQI